MAQSNNWLELVSNLVHFSSIAFLQLQLWNHSNTSLGSGFLFLLMQGFVFKNGRGASNCSPERFNESYQESDSYEHHWIVTISGELNIALLREDLRQTRVIALPLLKNKGLLMLAWI